jgi:hypothetical protein
MEQRYRFSLLGEQVINRYRAYLTSMFLVNPHFLMMPGVKMLFAGALSNLVTMMW